MPLNTITRWRTSRGWALLVIACGLLISVAAGVRQSRDNAQAVDRAIDERIDRLEAAVEDRMVLYRNGLRGARGAVIMAELDAIDAADFLAYSRSRDLAEEFPGARGFGFIRRVPEAELPVFLMRARETGNDSLAYRELAPHTGDRFVIEFIEPEASNIDARGLDIASELERRKAAERAGRTGQVAMTAPITLMQEADRRAQGVLLLLPVFRDGAAVRTEDERWAAVDGWAYAPLVIPEVLGTIKFGSDLDWHLTDVTNGEATGAMLFVAGSDARPGDPDATRDLAMFGRVWRIHGSAAPSLMQQLNLVSPAVVFATGVAITLLGGLLVVSGSHVLRRRREASVRDLEIAAFRRLEAERERLSAVLDGTNAGTWEWNVQTGETRFNERWAEIIGYRLEELQPTSIETWSRFAHPEDMLRSGAALEQHFSGRASFYECEARMRHRDGHWVWVLDRGRVKTRTPDGRPEWMFGTHLDISHVRREVEQRAASEALLTEMGELANVGGWSLDIARSELHWTAQTRRIHGVASDYQPSIETGVNFYAPEARETIATAVTRAIETGQGWDLELPLIRADGQRIWVRAAGRAVKEGGQAVRLVGAFQDVTESYLQRSALAEAHERLDAATEAAQIGIWAYEPAKGKTVWNRQAFLLHGEVPFSAEPDYAYWVSHLHPEDREHAEALVGKALSGRVPYRQSYRVVWPDGSVHHIETVARVFRDEAGEPVRVIGINRDITAEQLAEEKLRIVNRRLGLATASGGIGVWEWDLASNALLWDEQMYRLYDVPSDSPVEAYDAWASRVHPFDRQATENKLADAVADPAKPYDCEFRIIWPDGSPHTIKAKAHVTRNAQGVATAVTGVNWDMTSQRDLQSALVLANAALEDRVSERTQQLLLARDAAEAANRAKSEFLANMSHELRTPLHGILGFAKLIRDAGPDSTPEDAERYALKIVKNGDQLLALVDDLLDSAKIDYGNFRIDPESADLMAVIRSVVDEFSGRVRLDVAVTVSGPEHCERLIDTRRIGQVCRNLLANAIRLSPSGGAVEISVSQSTGHEGVVVEVADRGPGIPADELEAIFDRFSQSSKTKTGAGGTGLGLTIARSIAELHGGSLVAGNRDGGGAVFRLTL